MYVGIFSGCVMCIKCMCKMIRCYGYVIFFFKQKTAYEMRISDWSSDVCSSDLLAWGMVALVRRLRSRLRGALRYGLANVSRRAGTSIAQVTALALGLMALLLLTFVRTDLLDRWQLSLAQDAPNRFIINVQSDQVPPVRDFIAAQGLAAPTLVPMVRARLLERNGKPVQIGRAHV